MTVSQVQQPTLEQVQADLVEAHQALRKIVNVRPKPTGPNNQNFGVAGIRALEQTQHIALQEMHAQAEREMRRYEEDDEDGE